MQKIEYSSLSTPIKSVGRIYREMKIKCQPVAINSGEVWPKKGYLKPNKKITISILKAVEAGIQPDEFTSKIEELIYSELNLLS